MTTDLSRVATRVAALSAVVPDVAFACAALALWFVPSAFPHGTLRYAGNLMVFEFVVLHAAGFLIMAGSGAGPARRLVARAVLVLFYTSIAGWIAYSIGAWWPLAAFAVLLGKHFLPLLRDGVTDSEHRNFTIRWITATIIWLGAALLTAFAPVPRFGVTEGIVAVLGPGGEGLWEREPHRLIALAVLYYGAVAALEIRTARAIFRSGTKPAPGVCAEAS